MQTRINSLKASVERYLLLIKLNKNTKIIILIKNNLRGTLYLVLLDKQNRKSCIYTCGVQWTKKVVSNNLWLVNFAMKVVNSVLNLPDGQVKFFGDFKL